MGWKMKRVAALIIILVMLFVQYSGGTKISYAQNNDFRVSDEDMGEEGEEGDMESETETEKEQDKEDKEDKEEDREEEIIECYQLQIPEENGKNGYYISKPEIKIIHVSNAGSTRYCLINEKGQITEGLIKTKGEEAVLADDVWSEGRNRLSVWMEDGEGKILDAYYCEKSIMIDTQKPKLSLQTPYGYDAWYQKELPLSVSAEEEEGGSQIAEIVCYAEEQFVGKSTERTAVFSITSASVKGKGVHIRVTASDYAGNYTEACCEVYIDQSLPTAVLEGISDYKITSEPVQFAYQVTEENLIGDLEACTTWEHTDGETTEIPVQVWEDTENGKRAVQILSENGTYRMNLSVRDCAGYEADASAQVIIDKDNPVIRYIDQLNGRYLKKFCWEYQTEDWIHDYTSFSYTIQLDGKNYHMGETVVKEGRHILTVKAIDSAGNVGEAKAEFVIDRTEPKICFEDVEDGESYEKEKTFRISTEDKTDRIEEIRMNGELQKIRQNNGICQFHVQEVKNYEIEVKAVDMAGNQKIARIGFQVIPEKTMLQKLTWPIKTKILKEEKAEPTEEKKETEGNTYRGIITGGLLIIIPAVILGIRHLKKRRKREDAG